MERIPVLFILENYTPMYDLVVKILRGSTYLLQVIHVSFLHSASESSLEFLKDK